MVKTFLKLYATGVTTADAVASLIVPYSGRIVCINWSWFATTTGAVGGGQTFQLSAQSTGQFATSDVRNVLDELCATSDCVTTGIACGGNKYSMLAGYAVKAGDKIYLHRTIVSQVAFGGCLINVNMHLA